MLSMFRTTYFYVFMFLCTFILFYNMDQKHINSKERNHLTDETLSHLLYVSTSEMKVDFATLLFVATDP